VPTPFIGAPWGPPAQQAERERRNLRRPKRSEIGIRARRQMEVRRREVRVRRALSGLETPLPADLHAAVGADLGHRHRTRPRHRIDEGAAVKLDHLEAGRHWRRLRRRPEGQWRSSHGPCRRSRRGAAGEQDGALRPTLRQDEVGICIGCDRDRAAATKDRRRCASQRIARRARDPRVVGLASAPRKKTQVGRLACDMAAEAGRRWRRHQRARYRRRGCSTGCERCD